MFLGFMCAVICGETIFPPKLLTAPLLIASLHTKITIYVGKVMVDAFYTIFKTFGWVCAKMVW